MANLHESAIGWLFSLDLGSFMKKLLLYDTIFVVYTIFHCTILYLIILHDIRL